MRLITVKLAVVSSIVIMGVSYTNCSKVTFENSDLEATAQALGFKDGALVLINEGDEFTNSESVSLRLEHNDAEEMLISDLADCSGGVWEPMARKKQWKLAAKNNSVQVYARYRRFFAGNWIESACVQDAIVHDDIAPVVAIKRNPGSLFKKAQQQVALEVFDSGSGIGAVRCTADVAWSTGCNRNILNHTLSDGAHSIKLSAVDRAGNASEEVADGFSIDTVPPVVKLTATPAAVTAVLSGRFEFSAVDQISGVKAYECSANGGAFQACASPNTGAYNAGSNSFQVRATDFAGNVSAPTSYRWMIDTTAPSVTITSAPVAIVNSSSAVFQFVGTDDGVPLNQFECSMDGGAFQSCTTPKTYAGLGQGNHRFAVVAIDGVGLKSAPAVHNWMIDNVAPTIKITGFPDKRTQSQSASFSFEASDLGSGVKEIQCSLDGGAFAACVTGKSYSGLVGGSRVFAVKAVDNAGKESGVASYAWFIDRAKPVITITSAPAAEIAVITADFEFSATDVDGGVIASQECRMNSGAWEICNSPKKYEELAKGDYKFEVRATDSVGWVSDIAVHNFRISIPDPVVICDPFGSTTNTKSGVAARLAYYDGPLAWETIKKVDDVWNKGTKVEDTVILFGNIDVPTRDFTQGFEAAPGQKLKNSRGEDLVEWFSLDYTSEVKLADADAEGVYQFAVLSDDGAILSLDTGSGFQEIVQNDGLTPTRFVCGAAVNVIRTSRIPMRLKYFQGPRVQIAVSLLWRKVVAGTNMAPSYCGSPNDWFSGGVPTTKYKNMLQDGWKVMNQDNFQMKEVIPNVCKK